MSFSKGTITKPKSEKRTERSNGIIILRILREDKKIAGYKVRVSLSEHYS
jgi:hypothetical protein